MANPVGIPLVRGSIGERLYSFASELFPICRSLTGKGVRETLRRIQNQLRPLALNVSEIPSGTRCFDWEIPDEWNIRDAYIKKGRRKILDFKDNNLHVLGYSTPIRAKMPLHQLRRHLFSIPEQPDAIPYATSYYSRTWGFCLSERQKRSLRAGEYEVFIDSSLKPGSLTYADVLIPGELKKEVLLSTNICHPSLGNNETSGPVVATFLAMWLSSIPGRNLSYRIVFAPETIGAIAYLSRHWQTLKKNVIAGFQITCVGDDRAYSFLPSRLGCTLADKAATYALKRHCPDYRTYSFLDRGSDERQYCSPGIDLPFASMMRTKYGQYPEYHTSLDDMRLISKAGLAGAYGLYQKCLSALDSNRCYRVTCKCEPQLGKRGLYPNLSKKGSAECVQTMMNLIAYCDGRNDLLDIAERIGSDVAVLGPMAQKLADAGLLKTISESQ